MTEKIIIGNVKKDSPKEDIWIVGNRENSRPEFYTDAAGMRWMKLKKGQKRHSVGPVLMKTMGILIHGKHKVEFPEQKKTIVLEKEGDYVFMDEGTMHTWEALEDTFLISFCWKE